MVGRIALDAGHGMGSRRCGRYDPGATVVVAPGETVEEADVALAWVLSVKYFLVEAGAKVYLTRFSDEDDAPLGKRCARAEAAGCTRLLSIHCNAAESEHARGTETLYRLEKHKGYAQRIQTAADAGLRLVDRGLVKRPGLAILKFGGPCALLEVGFLTNAADRERITDRECRIAAAQRIAAALLVP